MVLELTELTVDGSTEKSLCEDAAKVVCSVRTDWSSSDLLYKVYTDGITNKLVGVYHKKGSKNDQLLVRVYGDKTELFIDRNAEKNNIRYLEPYDCGPVLYSTFANGVCYSFIPGDPLTTSTVVKEEVSTAVAKQMAKLNSLKSPDSETQPMLFTKLNTFVSLLPQDFSSSDRLKKVVAANFSRDFLQKASEELQAIVTRLECPVVLSHNDLLLANIIWREEQKDVRFIDFEYTAMNYQPFDVANHFTEFAGVDNVDYSLYPTEDFQIKWLNKYLSHLPPSGRPMQWWLGAVAVFSLAANLFWGTWAIVQAQHSSIDFDFAEYAVTRLSEYRRRKEEFLALGESAVASLDS